MRRLSIALAATAAACSLACASGAEAASPTPDLVNCKPKAYRNSQLGLAPIAVEYLRLRQIFGDRYVCDKNHYDECIGLDGPDGVHYGISQDFVVNKTMQVNAASRRLPFGIVPGDTVQAVSQKLSQARVGFRVSERDGAPYIGTGTCLLTRERSAYGVELTFDRAGVLAKIVERIVYP